METLSQLQGIFNEIQDCDTKKFTESIMIVLSAINTGDSFLRIIDTILVYPRDTTPPKVSHFLKRIFEELNDSNKPFLRTILTYLIDKTQCKGAKVRMNALRLVNMLASTNQDFLDDEVLARVAEKLFDKEKCVRKEALKVCIPFQNHHLNGSVTIQTTIKDIVRYDSSPEIRKLGLIGLNFEASTLNCILERCIDSSIAIRKAFWFQYFPQIDLRQLDNSQRIYLMKKGIGEREFDAKQIFLQRMQEYGLVSFLQDFYCEDREYDVCIEEYLSHTTEEYTLDAYTPSYMHFIYLYYRSVENKNGRDSLNLIPLDEYLQIFYHKCLGLEEMVDSHQKSDDIAKESKVLKYFLKILTFYDLFTADSKKCVYSIINHLLVKAGFVPLADECVSLISRIAGEDMVKIAGSLIKKTKGSQICMSICEAVMKYFEFGEIHKAIVSEIAILDIEQSLDVLFWFFLKNPSSDVESQYISFLPNKKVADGCADLVLKGVLDVKKIEECFLDQISRFNNAFVVPVCKLLLGKKLKSPDFTKYLLVMFYSTDNDQIQQYLSLFFFEYFRIEPSSLIAAFGNVLELISSNHRIFVDQSIFWISRHDSKRELQNLYFNVCVFILNNYDSMENRRHFFATLSKISPDQAWEPVLTKKIINLLGLIIRKRPRENVNLLLNQILEIDDGVPLSHEEFDKLRQLLNTPNQ